MTSDERAARDAYDMIEMQMQTHDISYAVLPGLLAIHPDLVPLLQARKLRWDQLKPCMDESLAFWNFPMPIRD